MATSEVALEVQFKRSGRTLTWDGNDANLLDFAERHGVAVESGCRSGSCGSCETRQLAGAVDYAQRPDCDPTPGHCLLCVGRPASALVLDA
jgi:ferredoxin